MIKNHISKIFNLPIKGHSDIDFVDIDVNTDTQLFIDPCLIEAKDDAFSLRCQQIIQDYFECLYNVYRQKRYNPDFLNHLGERNEARLGYGSGTNGKAKTPQGMDDTLSGLHDLIIRGIPVEGVIDIPLMMPRFAEDCMSDMLVNVLYKQLSEFTLEQCQKHNIPTETINTPRYYWDENLRSWNIYQGKGLVIDGKVILLIPKAFVSIRFGYSTSQFFMSQIATILQKERTSVFDGKEVTPRKADIKKDECRIHGSVIEATRIYAREMPHLLSEYHRNIKSKYQNRSLSDDELDKLVYYPTVNDTVA